MIPQQLLPEALRLSALAYESHIPFSIKAHSWFHSATAYLLRGSEYDILAFRGSNSKRDWALNLQAIPWRYYGAWVHMGFARAHKALWQDIQPLIDYSKPLLVTGHSLGGAMAELAAHVLDHKTVHLITFGKPRVFFMPPNETRLAYLETQLSVVHGSDVVARIPRILYGPDPGQDILFLSADGSDYFNPSQESMEAEWRFANAFSDHSIQLYKQRISTRPAGG